MGTQGKFRRTFIDVLCEGKARRIGWLLFGQDGSLYFHPKGKTPIGAIGRAKLKNGTFIKIDSADLSSIPLAKRSGVHLSLHPSGQVHVKAPGHDPLTIDNIGSWLPVRHSFVFGYVYTDPVQSLPIVEKSNAIWIVPDSEKSLEVDILILPRANISAPVKAVKYIKTRTTLTSRPSPVYIGFSPRYRVVVNISIIAPCSGQFYFLAGYEHQAQ